MDVFAFREELVSEYERFSRSFTNIRAEDILEAVNEAYAGGRFWPAPLIQLNPNFVPGGSIDDLVSKGTLDEECAKVFRLWLKATPSWPCGVCSEMERRCLHRRLPDSAANGKPTTRPGRNDAWMIASWSTPGRRRHLCQSRPGEG